MMHDPIIALLLGALGLVIGSFLNVAIHRLPKMMEHQWAAEAAEFSGAEPPEVPTFNLMVPRSRCPHCGHQIRWYENIPLLSYAALGGKCSSCKRGISLRYPTVELVTGALFGWSAWQFGTTPTMGIWCLYSALLLTLALIDWDTTFLPDDLTYPLLWAGLLASALGWTAVPLLHAVWGAAAGYLSLWLIYWAFKLLTGREGMGYGDFKLLAALGAWLGWQAILPIVLMASVIGAIVGIALKVSGGLREGRYVPFGPFLAGGGAVVILAGTARVLGWIGQ